MLFPLKTAVSTFNKPIPNTQEEIMIECPFCKSEMFLIKNEKFTCYNCFRSGNIVDFLAERDKISHGKALWKSTIEKPDNRLILKANKLALEFFYGSISQCDYFESRQISNESIAKFKLGYAPESGLIEFLHDKNISDTIILAAGLGYVYNGIQPMFKNRAMFPIADEYNRIVGFGGRRLDDNSIKSPKYINTAENSVFHKRNLLFGLNNIKTDTVYLVEGYMDVIALHQAGITNAVAALGTAVGNHHCSLLKEKGIKKVIVAMDCDEPGTASAIKAIKTLRPHFEVSILRYEGAKDPDEYIKAYGADSFKQIKLIAGDSFLVLNSPEKEKYSTAVDIAVDILF